MDEKDFERAELLAQIEINSGIARSRIGLLPPEDWDSRTCYECEIPLPSIRIQAGRYTCVDCQTRREKREKLRTG